MHRCSVCGFRDPIYIRMLRAVFEMKFVSRSGSAGVLVREVEESQSEQRGRLATVGEREQ